MTTLSVKIASPDPGEQEGDVQRLEVTHLAVMEMDAVAMRKPRLASPGIVILLPQFDSFTLSIDDKLVVMVPGMVHVLSGETEWHLVASSSPEVNEGKDASLKIIEFNALINGALSLQEVLILPARFHPGQSEEAERLWDDFMRDEERMMLAPGQPGLSRHLCAARLMELLLAAASITKGAVDMAAWDDRMLKLKAFLVANLSYPPSTDEMAQHLGMSRSRFYRWIGPLLGCSPAQYLRRLRLEKCQEKIRNSSLSIEQIAEMTGFSSRQHLWRDFTTEYKVTPARLQQSAMRGRQKNSAENVEVLIRNQRYEEALRICKDSLNAGAPNGPSVSHTQEQRARCLYAMGKIPEALLIWQELAAGPETYQAGTQLCSHYYRCGDFEQAAATLARLFPQATDSQFRDLIMRWCHQVAALVARRKSGPLPAYLNVRAKYFPDNARSMSVTAEALRGLGQEHRVVEECPGLSPERRLHSLRRAGLYRRGTEENGDFPQNRMLSTLMLLGKYEEVLHAGADDPSFMAKALARLGRETEAIRLYPDHCQEAYLSLGRYRELLDRWPEPSEFHLLALYALGRTDALRNYPDSQGALPQFLLGPDHFLAASNPRDPQFRIPALLWKAVQLLAAGESEQAGTFLAQIPLVQSPDFWLWPDFTCNETILTTVTRGLAGNHALALSEVDMIFAKLKYTDYQRTWHDAGFLLGRIDSQTYREQPCQADLENRLPVITVLKEDWDGRASAEMYRSLLARLPKIFLLRKPQLRALLHWRLTAAEGIRG